MKLAWIDILPVALLIVFLIGMKTTNEKEIANNYYLSKDAGNTLRGLFTIVVVFHHISQNTQTGLLVPPFFYVGHLAVAVFFFLSGYGVQKSHIISDKYKDCFLRRRLPKVLVPYVVVIIIYWLVYALIGDKYTLREVLASMVNGSPIVRYSWYILSITCFYVFFGALMRICKEKYNLMLIGACIWYAIYASVCVKLGYDLPWYKSAYLLIVGMLWAIYEKKITYIITKHYIIITPLTLFSFAVTAVAKIITDVQLLMVIFSMCSTVLFVLSVLMFTVRVKIGNRFLDFFGKISLEIYLIHGLFVTLLRSNCIYINDDFVFSFTVISASLLVGWMLRKTFAILKT